MEGGTPRVGVVIAPLQAVEMRLQGVVEKWRVEEGYGVEEGKGVEEEGCVQHSRSPWTIGLASHNIVRAFEYTLLHIGCI